MTEEDQEEFFEDVVRIDKVLSYVMEINGVCLRTMPALVSNTMLKSMVPLYAKGLENVPKSKEYELICSLCFFCDCLEHGSEELVAAIIGQLPQKFLQVLQMQRDTPSGEESRDLI